MSSVKVLITGIVSIVIQFGLAIVGWGGWDAFFAHPACLYLFPHRLEVPLHPGRGQLSLQRLGRASSIGLPNLFYRELNVHF